MNFISKPNLPQHRLKYAVVGDYPIVIDVLDKLGTEVFVLEDNPNLQKPIRAHADMTVLHLGGRYFLSYNDKLTLKLSEMGAICSRPQKQQCNNYPQDIALNCLIIDNYIACNTKYCADEVIDFASEKGLKTINTAQGYARCSVAVIDEKSVITADNDIAAKMSGEGFDVLQIQPGHILLPGYDYGFIGGCCGKIEKNKILFCGDIYKHPDAQRITEFIKSRDIEIICTHNGQLFDFGGMISVYEE